MTNLTKQREDLYHFSQAVHFGMYGRRLLTPPHVKEICDHIGQAFFGKKNRLIINMPPRAGKTQLAVKYAIAWAMGLWPDSHFIHASYSHKLAAGNTYAVREVMQSGIYQRIFPWVRIKQDRAARDEFQTHQGGVVYASGAGGTITGYGAGRIGDSFGGAIILDDVHKPDEALSPVMRESVIRWFQNTIESRKNSPHTPIILIMQRLHEGDLAGWLQDSGNGEDWTTLKIPAVTDDGKSFWPEQFPIDSLRRLEAASPYVFAGQYLQSPTAAGGGDFDPSKIEIVEAVPSGMQYVRGWDFAASARERGDYTATVKLGIHDGIVYIVDVDRGRWSFDEVERQLVQRAALDGADTLTSYPQDPGQAGKAQALTFSRLLQGRRFEFTTESGDKRTRAGAIAAQVNAGNVRIMNTPANKAFFHELSTFPLGRNDDMVDALSRAYNTASAGGAGVDIMRALAAGGRNVGSQR